MNHYRKRRGAACSCGWRGIPGEYAGHAELEDETVASGVIAALGGRTIVNVMTTEGYEGGLTVALFLDDETEVEFRAPEESIVIHRAVGADSANIGASGASGRFDGDD